MVGSMVGKTVLNDFFERIAVDPVIDAKHIALFMALYNTWVAGGFRDRFVIRSQAIMPLAKISSGATYFQKLHYLAEKGYIGYEPSHCGERGSLISLLHTGCTKEYRDLNVATSPNSILSAAQKK